MAALRFALQHLQKSTHSKPVFYPSRGGRCLLASHSVISSYTAAWKNQLLCLQHNKQLFASSSGKWTPPSVEKEDDIPDFPEKEHLRKLDEDETSDKEREEIAHELTEKLLGKMPVIETTPEEDAKYEKEVREEWDVMKASVGEDTLKKLINTYISSNPTPATNPPLYPLPPRDPPPGAVLDDQDLRVRAEAERVAKQSGDSYEAVFVRSECANSDFSEAIVQWTTKRQNNTSAFLEGLKFELKSLAHMEALHFEFERVGKTGDRGIDLVGKWALSNVDVPVIAQCKKTSKPLPARYLRELIGSVDVYSTLQLTRDVLAVFVSETSYTKEALEFANHSSYPMILTVIDEDGVSFFLPNPATSKLLPRLVVGSYFTHRSLKTGEKRRLPQILYDGEILNVPHEQLLELHEEMKKQDAERNITKENEKESQQQSQPPSQL